MKKENIFDWFLRIVKGAFMGMDFILPGVSGAALAVAFGLYERIVEFIAHITKDFWKNVSFFIPVALGGAIGIFLVSHPMSFLMHEYKTPVMYFFVGTILGTFPDIWHKSGAQGRKPYYFAIMILTFVVGTAFLLKFGDKESISAIAEQTKLQPLTALLAGAIVAGIAFIPGLSSSTVLLLLGFLNPLLSAIKGLDFMILIPFFVGLGVCVFPFSRCVDLLLRKAYGGFFHFILGIIFASVVLIIALASKGYGYSPQNLLVCAATLVSGAVFSYNVCLFSKKYE